jgi:hypothetical protein
VRRSLTPHGVPDKNGESCNWYGLQWWMGEHAGHSFFACRGLRGQYVVGIPDLDLVMVRLGHKQSKERAEHMPIDLFRYIEMTIRLASGNK